MAKRQKWQVGDVFLVPLEDGGSSIGQIIAHEKKAMNSVVCAFAHQRVLEKEESVSINPDKVVAVLFVTPDLLSSGDWLIVEHDKPVVDECDFFDMNLLRQQHYLGLKVIGSGIIIGFMNACFGLSPWNGYANENYLDGLLISPDKKPKKLMLV